MANLNDLPLNADTIPDVVVEDQPVLGAFTPPPQPGTFTFKLPPGPAIMNSFEIDETADQGQRLRASLRDEAALTNETLGEPYSTNVSNRTRQVKKGDDKVTVSDMAMLLNAVKSYPENNTNIAYGHSLIAAGGKRFMADHKLTAKCDSKRDIYKDGAVVPGMKGCGWKWDIRAYKDNQGTPVRVIPKDDNKLFLMRFPCENPNCPAEIRVWGQLSGFRETTE